MVASKEVIILLNMSNPDDLPKDKKGLHEGLMRERKYLPDIDSTICTKELLENIALDRQWCPLYTEIKILPCVEKPKKYVVMEELAMALTAWNIHFPITSKKVPNVEWALNVSGIVIDSIDQVLSTLNG